MLVSCYLFIIQGSLHITVYVSVCFHAIFMSPLWLNHPGLPILVSANEAHGTLADLHSVHYILDNAQCREVLSLFPLHSRKFAPVQCS